MDVKPTPPAPASPPEPAVGPVPTEPVQAPAQPVATPPAPVDAAQPTPAQPPAPTIAPHAEPKKHRRSPKLKSIVSTIAILLIAPLIALFITAFVFQSYQVDGQSMEATLQNNDRLIIWKVARTWSRLTNHDYIPKRGDIVVFIKKGFYEFNTGEEKQLIKRVIALPGEKVTLRDGVLTVYNKEHSNGFNPDKDLPYGPVITGLTEGSVDTTVPAGEVFLLGDNRGNSLDSRSFGPVAAHEIVGKLAARILPLSKAEKF